MIKTDEFKRLPIDVVPTHYNLELTPDLVKCQFNGKVSVKVKVCILDWKMGNYFVRRDLYL